MSWYIRLFGQLELERGERRLHRFRTAKTGQLLAYLALTPPHRFPRTVLADLLWGEDSHENARHSLNMAISALRHALDMPDLPAGQLLQTNRTSVALNTEHFTTDVIQFEQALALANRAEVDAAQRRIWLQRAVELHRGALLPECYEPWAVEAAARCQAECLHALRQLALTNDPTQRQHWLHRMLQLEPLDWEATEQLTAFYLQQGRIAQAQQVCDHYEAHWKRLYADPLPDALQRLQRQCMEARPLTASSSSERASTPPTRSRKQQAESEAPMLHLPRPANPFYGRTRELEQLWAWLIEGAARLVTLTGLGGIGKTRLAQEFAHRVEARNASPIWWVDLQAVPAPEFLWNVLQGALGLPAAPDPRQQTLSYLNRVQGVLVLDNYEQLLPEGATTVEALLAHAPDLRLLITSRAPLQVAGEYLLPLPPLMVEPEKAEATAPAVQLFADRAQRIMPDFRLTPERLEQVTELCRRLDGIPLALELAAARAGVLSPQQMLERLADRLSWLQTARRELPPRHRSLHAVLDACAESLDAETRTVWQRLSVFRGDFTLDAAQAVCPDADLWTVIEQLIAAGLLQSEERAGARRLRLLETLREYAWKQASPETQHAAQTRLGEWILSEAQTRAIHQFDDRLSDWLAFWDAEREHLLEALRLAEARGSPAHALELLLCTRRYWSLRVLQRFATAAVERLAMHLPPPIQAQARLLQAEWAADAGHYAEAHTYALQTLDLSRPDESTYAWALYYGVHSAIVLNNDAFIQQWGETAAQRTLFADERVLQLAGRRIATWYSPSLAPPRTALPQWFQASAHIARQLGDPLWIATTLGDWNDYCQVVGRYEESLSLLAQLGAIAEMLQDGVRLAEVYQARAYSLMQLGRLREAGQAVDDSLHWAQLSGIETGWGLTLKANLQRLQGDYERARELIQMAEQAHGARSSAFTMEVRGLIERDAGDLQAARRSLDRALTQRRAEGDQFRLHFARTHKAHLNCRLGEPDALEELQACLAFWREQDNSPWIATTLLYLAEAQLARGEQAAAQESLAESLRRNRTLGRRVHEAMCLELQATLREAEGDVTTAQQLLTEADAMRVAVGAPRPPL
ncbi:MAG: winged helix-turn-helix domain-containing protein [Fimbriimonadales bacterium]|nr:winged helix-turn-helix domain-containing protein [Fimbriimonadales bacterium]